MSTPPTPDLPARDFRYELAGAFIDSGCTEFVSRQMADEFLAAHAAAVRTAALTEAADEVDRLADEREQQAIEDDGYAHGMSNKTVASYRDVAARVRRLATTPTATKEH